MIPTGSEARVTHEVENMAMLPTQRGVNEPHRIRLARSGVGRRRPFREQSLEAPLDCPHVNAERRARERAVAYPTTAPTDI